jgi:LPS sulfotransferase NodH
VKQFAWYYEDRRQCATAIGIYLRGFRLMHDPELLLRAAAVWLPQAARDRLARAFKTQGRADQHPQWSSRVGPSPRRSLR